MNDCRDASVSIYQTADGRFIETFSVGAQTFDNEIPSPTQASQAPPAKVMWDKGLCTMPLPEPVATVAPEPAPPVVATAGQAVEIPNAGGLLIAGSAFMGLVGIVGIGVGISYAIKPDPTLRLPLPKQTFLLPPPPEVGADYTEPNPWVDPPAHDSATGSSPDATSGLPVEPTDFSTGSDDPVVDIDGTEQGFWDAWLPAPKSGYFISEESPMSASNSQVRRIVRDALRCGISKNKLCDRIFKISKASRQGEYLNQLIAQTEKELDRHG